MNLLGDLISKDPTLIWSAASTIRTSRDSPLLIELATHLAEIRASTQGVALGGTLRPNSSHLGFALRKLEWVRDSEGCLCGLYPLDDMYNPNREAEAGNIRILSTQLSDEGYLDSYEAECTLCGARFQVVEREYHYTWWKWKQVSTSK